MRMRVRGPPPPDPLLNVTALLHFDGDWTDQTGKTWTPVRVSIDAGTVKFGSGSGKMIAASGPPDVPYPQLTTPSHPDFAYGAGDYTIDFWINFYGFSPPRNMIRSEGLGSTTLVVDLYNAAAPKYIEVTQNGAAYSFNLAPGDPVLGVWYHVAVVRSGGLLSVYWNGNALAGSGVPAPDNIAQHSPMLDYPTYTICTRAYIDEYRESNVARWTSNFVPPVASYPPP